MTENEQKKAVVVVVFAILVSITLLVVGIFLGRALDAVRW